VLMNEGIDFPGYTPPVVQRLAIHGFDAARQAWLEVESADEDVEIFTLACATFNTWFQGEERELRYGGLLNVLEQSNADVIVLQEVTIQLLESIMSANWVRDSYRFARSPFRADAIPSHGTMLLSRLPFCNAKLHPIPTYMGRSLLTVEAKINGTNFMLATVHLESMKSNADTRGEQLDAIFEILERSQNVILAGDFNFCSSSREENSRIDPRYIDIWASLKPDEPGFTRDTEINHMVAKAKGESQRVRIDRILLRSEAQVWVPNSIELLGTLPVSPQYPKIFPSDHFGVIAAVRCSGKVP
jgi:tyrosyl-DNA phosphodiesterase 2